MIPAPEELELLERARWEPAGALRVQAAGGRFAAGALALAAARRRGLPPRACEAAQLATCELAGNQVRHAGGGTVAVELSAEAGALRVRASDAGPPIRDLAMALADGSTDVGPILPEQVHGRRGIGAGLGALRRLARALVLEQTAGRGKVITAYFGAAPPPAERGCLVAVREAVP